MSKTFTGIQQSYDRETLFRLAVRLREGTMHVRVYGDGIASNGGMKYDAFVWIRKKNVPTPHDQIIFSSLKGSFSPCFSVDGDDAKRHILQHIAMKPGDTDAEFFADYTKEQLDFVKLNSDDIYMTSIERYGED